MKKILATIAREILDQLWTVVALIIGWLVLEGTAKTVTANLVVGALIVWIVTSKFRNPKE